MSKQRYVVYDASRSEYVYCQTISNGISSSVGMSYAVVLEYDMTDTLKGLSEPFFLFATGDDCYLVPVIDMVPYFTMSVPLREALNDWFKLT